MFCPDLGDEFGINEFSTNSLFFIISSIRHELCFAKIWETNLKKNVFSMKRLVK